MVSGPLGLRTAHGLRTTWSPDHAGLGRAAACPFLTTEPGLLVGRGHACHAMHALHAFARTRIVLPYSFTGGQRTSCSRRTRALEAVLLSAIPVKRTAAASDLHCSFGWSCLGSSLGAVQHALTRRSGFCAPTGRIGNAFMSAVFVTLLSGFFMCVVCTGALRGRSRWLDIALPCPLAAARISHCSA